MCVCLFSHPHIGTDIRQEKERTRFQWICPFSLKYSAARQGIDVRQTFQLFGSQTFLIIWILKLNLKGSRVVTPNEHPFTTSPSHRASSHSSNHVSQLRLTGYQDYFFHLTELPLQVLCVLAQTPCPSWPGTVLSLWPAGPCRPWAGASSPLLGGPLLCSSL